MSRFGCRGADHSPSSRRPSSKKKQSLPALTHRRHDGSFTCSSRTEHLTILSLPPAAVVILPPTSVLSTYRPPKVFGIMVLAVAARLASCYRLSNFSMGAEACGCYKQLSIGTRSSCRWVPEVNLAEEQGMKCMCYILQLIASLGPLSPPCRHRPPMRCENRLLTRAPCGQPFKPKSPIDATHMNCVLVVLHERLSLRLSLSKLGVCFPSCFLAPNWLHCLSTRHRKAAHSSLMESNRRAAQTRPVS